ncbi:MAG TPA: hypothetical protein VFG54_04605 [Prolixibacteraceae bacterium]|nr:hypothetical protein [Prolixibacteraceae bacterium]
MPIIWQLIEWLNASFFQLFHANRFNKVVPFVLKEFVLNGYTFRQLKLIDLSLLQKLICKQTPSRLDFFNPHGFSENALLKTFRNPSFLMMGVFAEQQLIGYFFLRCFWNRKCFVGRLIDESYEGKGIGRVMNSIMYQIGWRSGFRVLSTISKNNHMVVKSHANNPNMIVLKELNNDFLYIEFLENKKF